MGHFAAYTTDIASLMSPAVLFALYSAGLNVHYSRRRYRECSKFD